jgi:hypothetical protein
MFELARERMSAAPFAGRSASRAESGQEPTESVAYERAFTSLPHMEAMMICGWEEPFS